MSLQYPQPIARPPAPVPLDTKGPEMNNSSVIAFSQQQHDSSDRPVTRAGLTPQSIEAEKSTLGAMMMERDAIARAVELLNADDFYRGHHRQIFTAIVTLFDKSEPVDLITVVEELRRHNQLQDEGVAYLTALIAECPSAANIESYAKVVSEKSLLRRMLAECERLSGLIYRGEDDVATAAVEMLQKQAVAASHGIGIREVPTVGSALPQVWQTMEWHRTHKDQLSGRSTGFPDLDRMTCGLQPTDLIIVGARPGMGKSAFMLQVAYHIVAIENLPVLIFSLEMSIQQQVQRLLTLMTGVRSQSLRRGWFDDDLPELSAAMRRIRGMGMYIDDQPALSTVEIAAKARRLTTEVGPLGIIAIDYLQLSRSSRKTDNRTQEIGEIARAFKALGRELKCPVMALSQLSREVEKRDDKRPMMSDLREGGIEAEADVVLFPYRPSYYDNFAPPSPDEAEKAEIIIGKQRNGPVGKVPLSFRPAFARFENRATEEES